MIAPPEIPFQSKRYKEPSMVPLQWGKPDMVLSRVLFHWRKRDVWPKVPFHPSSGENMIKCCFLTLNISGLSARWWTTTVYSPCHFYFFHPVKHLESATVHLNAYKCWNALAVPSQKCPIISWLKIPKIPCSHLFGGCHQPLGFRCESLVTYM